MNIHFLSYCLRIWTIQKLNLQCLAFSWKNRQETEGQIVSAFDPLLDGEGQQVQKHWRVTRIGLLDNQTSTNSDHFLENFQFQRGILGNPAAIFDNFSSSVENGKRHLKISMKMHALFEAVLTQRNLSKVRMSHCF